jgi:hypothetical protein
MRLMMPAVLESIVGSHGCRLWQVAVDSFLHDFGAHSY